MINKTEFCPPKWINKTWNSMVWQHVGEKNICFHFWPDPILNHEKAMDILSLFHRESSLFNLLANVTDPDHFGQLNPDPHQIEKQDPDPHKSKNVRLRGPFWSIWGSKYGRKLRVGPGSTLKWRGSATLPCKRARLCVAGWKLKTVILFVHWNRYYKDKSNLIIESVK